MKKHNLLIAVLMILSVAFLTAGGQADGEAEKVTLKFVTWDSVMFEYMAETNPMSELYAQTHPNVDIEIEKSKDSETFEQTMQIRAAAGELPDVMLLKPYMLTKYKEFLKPMNDHPSTGINKFADLYAVDGSIIALPTASFNEFVFYKKSIFEELGLAVPQTWGEFINVMETIKADGNYIPLAMGLKDAWPIYPFNEFMPLLESGDGNYYNEMASMDNPFSKGKPFYNAYSKIQDMINRNVMGPDPLGIGWDQAKAQFGAGEAAMMAAGQWFIGDYIDNIGGDVDDLGIFFLPVRDKASDPNFATVMADTFIGVPQAGKNVEEAEEFIKWFFDVYYEQILPVLGVSSTIEGIEISGNPVLEQIGSLDQPEFILVEAAGEDFTAIKNAIQFDVKRIGQEMASGAHDSFETLMETLSKQWSDAK